MRAFLNSSALHRGGLRWLASVARLALCAWVLCAQTLSFATTPWPSPKLPESLHTFSMGPQLALNGLPIRMQGFVADLPPTALLVQLRSALGQPLVESTVGGKLILGRAEQGGYYLTVQVEASGLGSKGIVAVTNLGEMSRSHDERINVRSHWLDRLPSGSVIASQMSSTEIGKSAMHLVFTNTHTVRANRDALLRLLSVDGYRLERESGSMTEHRLDGALRDTDGQTMYFTGNGREGLAVIARQGNTTSIVLNTVVTLKEFQ